MTGRGFRDRLNRRARRAGVQVSPELARKLEIYYRLLTIWNQKINLTGFSLEGAATEAIDRLLIEPLIAAQLIPVGTTQVVDIGSGGGSPAIPLALANPNLRVLLVESKTRKSVFLSEIIRATELQGAAVAATRFEQLLTRPDLHEKHDLLTIRAVKLEARTLMSLQAFLRPGGLAFLFRGSGGQDVPDFVHPPMRWIASYPLIESLRSRLVVLEKRQLGRST